MMQLTEFGNYNLCRIRRVDLRGVSRAWIVTTVNCLRYYNAYDISCRNVRIDHCRIVSSFQHSYNFIEKTRNHDYTISIIVLCNVDKRIFLVLKCVKLILTLHIARRIVIVLLIIQLQSYSLCFTHLIVIIISLFLRLYRLHIHYVYILFYLHKLKINAN